jgi:hypothetical protein
MTRRATGSAVHKCVELEVVPRPTRMYFASCGFELRLNLVLVLPLPVALPVGKCCCASTSPPGLTRSHGASASYYSILPLPVAVPVAALALSATTIVVYYRAANISRACVPVPQQLALTVPRARAAQSLPVRLRVTHTVSVFKFMNGSSTMNESLHERTT